MNNTSEKEKIDQVILIALIFSMIAIAFSAAAITWSVSQTTSMRSDLDHALDKVDVAEIYINNLHADLKAHGFNPEERK